MKWFQRSGKFSALHRLDKHYPESDLVARLKKYVEQAIPHDLLLGNPRQLAHELGISEHDALRLIAIGAHEKLFQALWLVRCPHCGGMDFNASHAHLGDLPTEEVTCPACRMRFEIEANETLNIHYRPTPAVMSLEDVTADEAYQRQLVEQWGLVPAWAMLNLPEFRNYLADLQLPEGATIGVQAQTFWFTDLLSSTSMYEKLGDARAYALVRDHYQIVFGAAEAQGGYAVKTIGDGTMGNFNQPVDALRAGIAAVRGVMNMSSDAGWPCRIRLGLHTGPCRVVALNGRIDFFGTTVNKTARLEAQATGTDIVLSAEMMRDHQVAELAEATGPVQPFDAKLRGLAEAQTMYRLQLAAQMGSDGR